MSTQKKESTPKREPAEVAFDNVIEVFHYQADKLSTEEVSELLEALASEFEDMLEEAEQDNLLEEIDTDDWDLMDEVDMVDFDDHDGQ